MATISFFDEQESMPPTDPIESRLIITHSMSKDGEGYVYSFTENEIVTRDPDQKLKIVLDARLKSGFDAYIDSFVTTNRPPIKKVDPPTDANGRFPATTSQIEFEMKMKIHEFIFFGIIVGIKKPGGSKYEFILCDPQVGNGPPNGNMPVPIR